MTWGQVAVGVTSAVLVLVGTWVSSRFSAKVGHQANEITSQANRTADWDSFTEKLERDNARLRERLDAVESKLDEFRRELRDRDSRIDDLSDDLDDAIDHIRVLRDELLRQDPSLTLPEPPARIARHFQPP